MKGSVEAFKAACLFVPKHAVELKPDADTIDCFTQFPFLTSEVIAKLKSELSSYLVKAADAPFDTPVMTWWKDNESNLPFCTEENCPCATDISSSRKGFFNYK